MKKGLILSINLLIGVFFLLFVYIPEFTNNFLTLIFPGEPEILYTRASLSQLLMEHIFVVFLSETFAVITGTGLGIYVTRSVGRFYLPLVQSLSSMAQTLPPTAVLALAIPLAGFGFRPVIIALFIYSSFPVITNTISGLENVPKDLIEASRGLGMRETQILTKTELPLAAPVILAGIRTSTIINIGTATIGAVAGAGGLGNILMAGLIHDNRAYIFTGALSASLLAFFTDHLFVIADQKIQKTKAENT